MRAPGSGASQALDALLAAAAAARGLGKAEFLGSGRFTAFAEANVLTLRSLDLLRSLGIEPHPDHLAAAAREEERTRLAMELIGRLAALGERSGIPCLFPKAFSHYPDMGHDVDLLVLAPPGRMPALIARGFPSRPGEGSLVQWIAGKTALLIEGFATPVEIHQGRMGVVGEHSALVRRIFEGKRARPLERGHAWLPSPEDQLVLQAVQRIFGHPHIRLCDLLRTVELAGTEGLDWGRARSTARAAGSLHALRLYLELAAQAHPPLRALSIPRDLLAEEPDARLGRVRFDGNHYRPPSLSCVAGAFARKLAADAGRLELSSVARLCLLPPLFAWTRLREAAGCG